RLQFRQTELLSDILCRHSNSRIITRFSRIMDATRRTPPLHISRGFTMLEIVLALVVLGIVSAASAGKIHDLLIQERVIRASTAVENGLEAAFALATRNRQPVRISWSPATMQVGITDRTGLVYYQRVGLGADAYGLQ